MIQIAPLETLAIASEVIIAARTVIGERVCRKSNIRETSGSVGSMIFDRFYERSAFDYPAIKLHSLPSGMTLASAKTNHFFVGDCFVEEQIGPAARSDLVGVENEARMAVDPIRLSGEHLIVGRFGQQTWGHWLGELLPKIVLAERIYPRRFSYVMSNMPFVLSDRRTIWTAIRESLEAYGIGPDRLSAVRGNRAYTFESLFAITPLLLGQWFHPAGLQMMREDIRPSVSGYGNRISLFREGSSRRNLTNGIEIQSVLDRHDFGFPNLLTTAFADQTAAFREADTVVSILGSSLTGLIYAPEGVRVLSIVPPRFADRFFYGLVQERKGEFIDLRGDVVAVAANPGKDDDFHVDTALFEQYLEYTLRQSPA